MRDSVEFRVFQHSHRPLKIKCDLNLKLRFSQKTIPRKKTHLSRVDARGIRRVTLVSFEGVKVLGGTRGRGVPLLVNILLGDVVPKLAIVFTVFEVELGGDAGVGGGHEGRGGGHKGNGKTTDLNCGHQLLV